MAELKDANENPWYVLMTLYGEQEGDEIDWKLHRKNSAAWNAWSCQRISDQRKELFEYYQGVVPEPSSWSDMEEEVRVALKTRAKWIDFADLPSPSNEVNLARTQFDKIFAAQGYIFAQAVTFSGSKFEKSAEFGLASFLETAEFARCSIEGDAHFGSTSFLGKTDFSDCEFKIETDFSFSVIHDTVEFLRSRFLGHVSFSAAAFFSEELDGINFGSAEFVENAIFSSCFFGGFVSFKSAKFRKKLNFFSCQAEIDVDFSDAEIFEGGFVYTKFGSIGLHGATFVKRADFTKTKYFRGLSVGNAFDEGATFNDGATFSGSTFVKTSDGRGGGLSIRKSHFSGPLDISETHIAGDLEFDQVELDGRIDFSGTCFEGEARIVETQFRDIAVFSNAKFNGNVALRSCEFEDYIHFHDAEFGDSHSGEVNSLDFTDTQMNKPASFRDAKFNSMYPTFPGAIIDPKTIFPWNEDNWPKTNLQPAREGRDSCAFLRHHMAQQGLPEAEQFFFKREMKFAERDGDWFHTFPYRFYGLISDYGASIVKPVRLIAALWIIPALIYFAYFSWLQFHPIEGAYSYWNWDAFGYSFANIFKFFGIQRTYFGAEFIAGLPPALELLSAAQTVFGYILLFFLGLGLRSRFRLR